VVATWASGVPAARNVEVLVDSLRRFGGRFSAAPVYVVADETAAAVLAATPRAGVKVLPLDMPAAAAGFPYAEKAWAAAQVEALVADSAATMVWMDAATLVLGEMRALDLAGGGAVALRPVSLVNRVGLAPDAPLDGYWAAIYREAGADPAAAPAVQSVVDAKPVRFYVNCEIIAWRPGAGISREWSRVLGALLADTAFRERECGDAMHRIFLHQAALSAVILARTRADERRWLPPDHGYSLLLHDRLPAQRRAARLDDLACAIYDTLWDQRPDWPASFAASAPLAAFLRDALRARLRVTGGIFREEGACNTYLVETAGGGVVVIDPGGAATAESALYRGWGTAPLHAILLTHAHPDHRAGIALWRGGRDVPVIAQERFAELLADTDRIAPLLAARSGRVDAATGGAPPPPALPAARAEITRTFGDRLELELGGTRFVLLHTPAETPDTAIVWIPEARAAAVGDSYFGAFPNLATPRGGRTRRALEYVAALDAALALDAEALLPGHEEPVVGAAEVRRRVRHYRDAIAYVHDAVVRGLNEGRDAFVLAREIALPEALALPQYFGRVDWAVRGIALDYAGWWDGDVASLYAVPPAAVRGELVALAGGAAAVAARSAALLAAGDAVRALHLADAALAAEPASRAALTARAAALAALRASSRNYFERAFLDAAIRSTQQALETEAATSAAP
jgi:glyoxylase-like metal-dependent hydrolase (beta-lactamase superfamily II)